MPCDSIVELIQITLNNKDCLQSYELIKRTCGRGVGENSLLQEQLAELPVWEIMALKPEVIARLYSANNSTLEFLCLKHIIAVQSVLHVYAGHDSGGVGNPCAVAEISHDNGHVVIEAQIDIDLMAEQIKACQHCEGN